MRTEPWGPGNDRSSWYPFGRAARPFAVSLGPEGTPTPVQQLTEGQAEPANFSPSASAGTRRVDDFLSSTSFRALAIAAVVLIALNAGYQVVNGGSLYAVAGPAAVAAGIGLVLLALFNFEAFIVVILVVRSALDWSRGKTERSVGGGSSGPWTAGVAALVILGGVMWLVARRQRGRAVSRLPLEVALVAFVGTSALSVLAASQITTSIVELSRIAAAAMMFFVLRRLLTEEPRAADHVLTAVFASALLPLIVAAGQFVTGSGAFHSGGYERVRGTFVHPNPFALYLTLVIAMGVALFPYLRGIRQLMLGALMAGCGVAMLLTYTRTGWLAVFAALLVVGLLQSRRLVLMLGLTALLALVAVPSITERFADLREGRTEDGRANNSLLWRVDYWQQAVDLAKDSPIIGVGLKMTQSSTDEAKQPHNDFIRAYAETGILGLIAYIGLLAALVRTAWNALRRAAAGRDRGIAVGFAGCVVAFLLLSLVSNALSQVVLLWYFFAFAATANHIAERSSDV